MSIITDIDVAKLMQHLSVFQAASLIVGVSPASIYIDYEKTENDVFFYQHRDYNIGAKFRDVLSALTHAVKFGALKATIAYITPIERDRYGNPSFVYQDDLTGDWFKTAFIDVDNTFIQRHDLKQWLLSHDVKPPLLFTDSENDNADYLNKEHERYVPKLALCIRAWQSSQYLPDGVAVGKWLQEYIKDHAAEYELSDSDTMAESLAAVSNWNKKGGNKPTFPYVRANIPNDYSQIPNKAPASVENDSFLPEFKDFIESKPIVKDKGVIPF